MADLLAKLNPMQQLAVKHDTGPLLLLAGAGSGKTRVLTHRIAWLIQQYKVDPWQILAVTFTNKAAGEMKERLEEIIGDSQGLWVSTFHSACVRILRQEIEALGFNRNFTIYDDQDQERLLKVLLQELGIDEKQLKPRAVAAAIDRAKNKGLWPEQLEDNDYQAEQVTRIYALYQERLKQANALDFGDLLMQTPDQAFDLSFMPKAPNRVPDHASILAVSDVAVMTATASARSLQRASSEVTPSNCPSLRPQPR